MPKLKQSSSQKAQFAAYAAASTFQKNKLARMLKTINAQPNNEQIQVALERVLAKGAKYTRSRKTNGHVCKGLNTELGFVNNMPNGTMIKSKLPIHYFHGSVFKVNPDTPNHGQSMCTQLEALGYEKKRYVRKYKKTAR